MEETRHSGFLVRDFRRVVGAVEPRRPRQKPTVDRWDPNFIEKLWVIWEERDQRSKPSLVVLSTKSRRTPLFLNSVDKPRDVVSEFQRRATFRANHGKHLQEPIEQTTWYYRKTYEPDEPDDLTDEERQEARAIVQQIKRRTKKRRRA